MKIMSVVGARPNFVKIAPFIEAVRERDDLEHILVHTGQHYDDAMSKQFFQELSIPYADINLGVGSGTHAEQIARTMMAFEPVLLEYTPDWVVVVGDVNATSACSQVAKKYNIQVAHIEAGLRSNDMTMPEEINRIITDRLSDLLLVPDCLSCENLQREGCAEESIKLTGNIMIDTLNAQKPVADLLDPFTLVSENLIEDQPPVKPFVDSGFILMTLHRPGNVDNKEIMERFIEWILCVVACEMLLIWPIHPRAEKMLKQFGLWDILIDNSNIALTKPLGYRELLCLNSNARMVLTDSGGLQEECCVLGTPTMVLRSNTERPITLQENGGTCVLAGNNITVVQEKYAELLKAIRRPSIPELWDGHTALRCVDAIVSASV